MIAKTSSLFFRTLLIIAGVPILIFSTAGNSAATPLLAFGTAILDAGNGSVIVSGNGTTSGCINWYNGGTAPTTCPDVGGTGSFTVDGGSTAPFVAGQTGTIQDLSFQTTYPLVDFMVVNRNPKDIFFDLEDIRFNGGAAIGDCSAGANDPGATCTPADSPFQLTNGLIDPNNGLVDTVSVAFTVDAWGYANSSGTNYDAATQMVGTFTTQEAIQGATIQSILNEIASGGSVTASWSATFTPEAPTSPVPEPVSFLLLGIGLTAIGCYKRNARKV